MSHNSRRITQQFHNNNHTKIDLLAFTNTTNMNYINEAIGLKDSKKLQNLNPGVYCTLIGDIYYIFLLMDTISGDDYLLLNRTNSYVCINGKRNRVLLYKYMKRGTDINEPIDGTASNSLLESTLQSPLYDRDIVNYKNSIIAIDPNLSMKDITGTILQFTLQGSFTDNSTFDYYRLNTTVNTIFDGIILDGYTMIGSYVRSPYYPTTLNSISSFNIRTMNGDRSYDLKINLKNNIKRLPSGVSDSFIMDSYTKRAFIIFRVGRLVLTGNENWQIKYKTDNYTVFFLKYDTVSIGEDDTSIFCNYFDTITNTDMIYDKEIPHGISNSNDNNNRGIYIRMPNDLLENKKDMLESFRQFLKNAFKSSPVIIEYLLNKERYKSVLLDEYCIKQFYPYTLLNIDYITKIICLSRVLKIR